MPMRELYLPMAERYSDEQLALDPRVHPAGT